MSNNLFYQGAFFTLRNVLLLHADSVLCQIDSVPYHVHLNFLSL